MHYPQATLVLTLLACYALPALADQPQIKKEVRDDTPRRMGLVRFFEAVRRMTAALVTMPPSCSFFVFTSTGGSYLARLSWLLLCLLDKTSTYRPKLVARA